MENTACSTRIGKKFPRGIAFTFKTTTEPPLVTQGTAFEIVYSGSTEMHEKFGLGDVENEPFGNVEVVRQDPEFWELFVEKPYMVVTKAKKRSS